MNYRRIADQLLSEYNHARRQVKDEKQTLSLAHTHLSNATEAQEIAQAVAQTIQQQAHSQIAGVVSRCLETIFGDEAYEFKIEFERKRGKTEANLLFVRDGEQFTAKEVGGGVVDVASFALRLACLMLSRPRLRRLMVADEPFKHLSRNHSDKVRDLLEQLSREMKVQIIMITHSTDLEVGKVIELD